MPPDIVMHSGFDPAVAAHFASSVPVYIGALAVAHRLRVINPRIELAVAFALTSVFNVLLTMQSAVDLIPAISAGSLGAMGAMIAHALMTKQKNTP